MKIEELEAEWKVDHDLDRTNMQEEFTKIPRLHSKYINYYNQEKKVLLDVKSQYDIAYKSVLQKLSYDIGPDKVMSKEERDRNPGGIKPLQKDVDTFIQADAEIIRLSLRIGLQNIKIDFLKSVMDSISKRHFLVQQLSKHQMFEAGN